MIDEGFEIKIDNTKTDIVITIKSSKLFFWDNVKDDILPFLEVLEEKFYFNDYSKVDFCSLSDKKESFDKITTYRRLLLRDVIKDDKIVINNELTSIKVSEDYITFLRNNF